MSLRILASYRRPTCTASMAFAALSASGELYDEEMGSDA